MVGLVLQRISMCVRQVYSNAADVCADWDGVLAALCDNEL